MQFVSSYATIDLLRDRLNKQVDKATTKQVNVKGQETLDFILRFRLTKNPTSSLRSSQRVGSLSTLFLLK
jgi:hypothetical protein